MTTAQKTARADTRAAVVGARLEPVTAIEAGSPIESLTMYRALVVCHMAGAVFVAIGWLTARGAVAEPLQTALLAVAVVQFAVAWWLLRNPAWLPRLLLGFPQPALALSIAMTLFYLAPATDPVSPPTTTVAFAWIATAAAVLPPRGWPWVGLAATVAIAVSWSALDFMEPGLGIEAVLIGAAAVLPGSVNGAWMGATGNRVARRVRRWGLVIGSEAGAIGELTDRARVVQHAADDVLSAVGDDATTSAEAISAETLRHATQSLERDRTSLVDTLRSLASGPRLPYAVQVVGDGVAIDQDAEHVVAEALLRHLTNVAIHAPAATQVVITVRDADGTVDVVIEDDGGGAAPTEAAEGEGTALSRGMLARWGGALAYRQGPAGVRLLLRVPSAGARAAADVGLVAELRSFIDQALRNNRLASYASPLPFLAFGDGGPVWAIPLLLTGAAVIEWSLHRAGPSAADNPLGPLVLPAAASIALTLLFALGLDGDQAFVCSAATAYPVIELAWRGHWKTWLLFEVLRAGAVLPWLLKAGIGGVGGAFVLPLALTLIAVGARRLVMRATAVEARIGSALERRSSALDLTRQAALRHDVVDQLRGGPRSPRLTSAVRRLDAATRALADVELPPLRPADDFLEGVRTALAPVPLVVAPPTAAAATANETASLPAPLRVERRLALLELGATIGEQISAGHPPAWSGRPRLGAVRATFDGSGSTTVRLSVDATDAHVVDDVTVPGDLAEVTGAVVSQERGDIVVAWAGA